MNIRISAPASQPTLVARAAKPAPQKTQETQEPKPSWQESLSDGFETYVPYGVGALAATPSAEFGALVGTAIGSLTGSASVSAFAGTAGAGLGYLGGFLGGTFLAREAMESVGNLGESLSTSNPSTARFASQAVYAGVLGTAFAGPMTGFALIASGVTAAAVDRTISYNS